MSEEQKGVEQGDPEAKDKEGGAKSKTKLTSAVPERTEGALNPSSPGNTGTTPGTNAKVG